MRANESEDMAHDVLRLWHYPPHASPFTWTVVVTKRGHAVRRTLDVETNPPTPDSDCEATLSATDLDVIMGELERVSICPAASSELVLDVGHYGVEIDRYPTPVVLAWAGAAPIGWEALEAWHHRTRHRLDRLLPRIAELGYEYQSGGKLTFED